jgi:hypothetical protein
MSMTTARSSVGPGFGVAARGLWICALFVAVASWGCREKEADARPQRDGAVDGAVDAGPAPPRVDVGTQDGAAGPDGAEGGVARDASGGPPADAGSGARDAEVVPDRGPSPATCSVEQVEPLRIYHIGHSLTDRMADLLNYMVEAHTGQQIQYAYKSIPGCNLWFHWENPSRGAKGNMMNPDAIDILRTGNFDALSLTERTGIDYLLNHETRGSKTHANLWVDEFLSHTDRPNPRVFIYSTWWGRNEDGPDTPETIDGFLTRTLERQPAWEEIAEAVRDAHPDTPVHIVPGGLVLTALQERVLEGSLVLPNGQTYRETFFKLHRDGCMVRDYIHLSQTGIYAIALAHYAVIYQTCPIGMPSTVPYRGYGDQCIRDDSVEIDPALALAIQETVWDVVRGYAWSGLD